MWDPPLHGKCHFKFPFLNPSLLGLLFLVFPLSGFTKQTLTYCADSSLADGLELASWQYLGAAIHKEGHSGKAFSQGGSVDPYTSWRFSSLEPKKAASHDMIQKLEPSSLGKELSWLSVAKASLLLFLHTWSIFIFTILFPTTTDLPSNLYGSLGFLSGNIASTSSIISCCLGSISVPSGHQSKKPVFSRCSKIPFPRAWRTHVAPSCVDTSATPASFPNDSQFVQQGFDRDMMFWPLNTSTWDKDVSNSSRRAWLSRVGRNSYLWWNARGTVQLIMTFVNSKINGKRKYSHIPDN